LCSRGHTDPVSKAFCGATPPTIKSLDDVINLIGLKFDPPPYIIPRLGQNPGFMINIQSTGLGTRSVSVINPRTVLFTPPHTRGRMTGAPQPNASYTAMGFSRGEQMVEILAKDPDPAVGIRFFLLKYTQACNTAPGGCTPGDLYTPAVESNFTSWSLYDDGDLKDTVVDCLSCHQPTGPGTQRILRLPELQRPWPHWVYNDAIGADQMRADYYAAHGKNESYGGVPAAALDFADMPVFEAFVENNGFINQPNEFQSVKIMNDLGYGSCIAAKCVSGGTGSSPTWQTQYQASETGQFIPTPYYDFSATDPALLQAATTQYAAVQAGTLPPSMLGDLRNVFNDAQQRAMTHKPALGLTGQQILVQACSQCHNSQLDQTLSRARFNVMTLGMLPKAEKTEAIRRLNLPPSDCQHMPPQRFRDLDASEIAAAQAVLSM
jgi:hypothetical protein